MVVCVGFPEVRIGARYLSPSGEPVDVMPSSLTEYASLSVQYETMPGWTVSESII